MSAVIEEAKALHSPMFIGSTRAMRATRSRCQECGREWPCRTLQILEATEDE